MTGKPTNKLMSKSKTKYTETKSGNVVTEKYYSVAFVSFKCVLVPAQV